MESIKKKKILFLIILILILIGAVCCVIRNIQKKNKPIKEEVSTMQTVAIEKMDLANSINVTGTIVSANAKIGKVSLSGLTATEVCVSVGDSVKAGDVICRFDSQDIEEALAKAKNNYSVNKQIAALENDYQTQYEESIQQADDTLQNARSKRDEARNEHEEAEVRENAAKEAVDVASAELLAKQEILNAAQQAAMECVQAYEAGIGSGLVLNDLDSYINNLDKNGAAYTACKDKLEAYLAAKEAVNKAQQAVSSAQSDYEKAMSEAVQAYNNYEQAQSAREDAQKVYEDSVKKAGEEYEKAKLNAKLITESTEEKQIEEYEEQLADCTVYAAMDGVIVSLNVEEGEEFQGGEVYEVQDMSYFVVDASVDEYDVVDLKKGMSAYVKTNSMGEEEMAAEVTFISPTGTAGAQMGSAQSTASYALEISITDPQERLYPGMTAQVSISLEESKDALAVPYDCVQTNKAGESVIYVDENGQRKEIKVKTGISTDYYTEIISDELTEGMQVYLSTPMLQGEGGTTDKTEGVEDMIRMPMGDGNRGGQMPSGAPGGGPGGF